MPQERLIKQALPAKVKQKTSVGRPRTDRKDCVDDLYGFAWDFTQAK